MRRNLFNILLLLLIPLSGIAQEFTGLIDGNKWIFYCTMSINPEEYDTDYYWTQEVKGDTIIEGYTYKKVYNTITGWENESDIVKPLVSFFCQEENKIYEWRDGERVLNYDFNMQSGETFYTAYDIEMIVDSVAYKNMPNNQLLKHLYVSVSQEQYVHDMWIEGIGSTTDGLNESTIGNCGSGRKLISFISQGKNLLSTEHEYIPLLSPTSEWVESAYKAYVRYAISDTTTIEGKEYCVLSCTEMILPEKEIQQSNVEIYIREEGKKVYLYEEYAPEKEYLLYDFEAKAGDKIVVNNAINEDCVIAINSVETIILDGSERNKMHVSYIYNNESLVTDDIWIEGIGSTQFFPFNNIMRWGGSGYSYFLYFYDNSTGLIYPEDATQYNFDTHTDHEYIPFVEEGKVWVEYDYMDNYSQVGIYGKTTINQKEYHNLYRENFSIKEGKQTATSDSRLHGYIREDEKKVYLRGVDNEAECLIYDFGIQVGNTVEWTNTWGNSSRFYIMADSIKSAAYYGEERNVFYVTCLEEEPNGEIRQRGNDVWIEGVGSLEYPIMSLLNDMYRWGASGMQYFQYCYNYNTQEIFPTTATPNGAFSYPAPASVNQIEREKTTLTLHREGDNVVAVFPAVGTGEAITLYDMTGRAVATQTLREGATSATLDIAHLPQGVYIARLGNTLSAKVVL